MVENITPEQYGNLLNGVNGLLRGKSKESWAFDGGNVNISAEHDTFPSAFFMHPDDKSNLINQSLQTAKTMTTEGRDMSDVAYLLAAILVETHPYADGNGRTGRVIYDLMANGYDPDRLKILLSEEGRGVGDVLVTKRDFNQIFFSQMNTGGLFNILPSDEGHGFGKIAFPKNVSESTKETIVERVRGDTEIFKLAVVSVLESHPEMPRDNYVKETNSGNKVLVFERLVKDLSSEIAEELVSKYWEFKKSYTETIIDVFAHPDKPEYQVNNQSEGQSVSLLDKWKTKLTDK